MKLPKSLMFRKSTAKPADAKTLPSTKAVKAKPLLEKPAKAQPPKTQPVKVLPATRVKTLDAKALTEGQRVYETKRAAKAGMSLDKWLASKQRQQEADEKAKLKAVEAAKPPKPAGLLGRLLERAHRPLGS